MSFSSRSKSRGHYPNKDHGSGYYKKPHGSGGIFGKIVETLTGSKRHSRSNSGHENERSSSRHHRRSSWS